MTNNSFGSELLVMKSLRLPKRLTMHGDDEKDHMFLVRATKDKQYKYVPACY